jgi:thioredoxin-dependent peroxiredoxin
VLQKTLNIVMVLLLLVGALTVARAAAQSELTKPPAVGDKAPDFVLNDLDGAPVSLGEQLKHGPAVVIVLRGYPGYQCPICSKQFGELLGKAKEFADAKATVLFIYPGPANDLDKYAKEFVGGKTFPENYRFLIDPDFRFTDLYKLRWNAPLETAYPSSFVVDADDVIRFAKVSHSHGDRASSEDLLSTLTKLSK